MGDKKDNDVFMTEAEAKALSSTGEYIPDFNASNKKINSGESQHNRKQDEDTNKAKKNTFGDFKFVKSVPGTFLNKWQNANSAKDGGQYGSLNGKNFNETLHLSRAADAYNNRPDNYIIRNNANGPASIIKDERKNIETEEMREMQRNRQLDLNQKELAQQLQAAINRKDYDAFTAAYKQIYGIELDNYHAKNIMNQWARQQDIMQHINNNSQFVIRALDYYFGATKAKTIFNVAKNNPQLAELLSDVFTGRGAPNSLQMLEQEAYDIRVEEILNTKYGGDESKRYYAMLDAGDEFEINNANRGFNRSKDYKNSASGSNKNKKYNSITGKWE